MNGKTRSGEGAGMGGNAPDAPRVLRGFDPMQRQCGRPPSGDIWARSRRRLYELCGSDVRAIETYLQRLAP